MEEWKGRPMEWIWNGMNGMDGLEQWNGMEWMDDRNGMEWISVYTGGFPLT